MVIQFRNGLVLTDQNGNLCDEFNRCDAYVKVKVDGKEVWRGKTQWNNAQPKFLETYSSPRMRKDSKVQIELWDNDSKWTDVIKSDDDLMDKWYATAESLSKYDTLLGQDTDYAITRNQLNIRSSWRDE